MSPDARPDNADMTSPRTRATAVLIAFVVLAVAPFAYAATRSWFWQHEYLMAPVATALYLVVVTALVVGRYRWTWWSLTLFYGVAIVSWIVDFGQLPPRYLLALAMNLSVLGLLLSSSMRDRLRRPVHVRLRRSRISRA